MDARSRLRRYLEQRREAGERELVLDDMSVEEVMRILGAASARAGTPRVPRSPEKPRAAAAGDPPLDAALPPVDWRAVLGARPDAAPANEENAMGARKRPASERRPEPPEPTAPSRPSEVPPSSPRASDGAGSAAISHASTPLDQVPTGIVIGSASHELFGPGAHSFDSLEEIAAAVAECTRCPLFKTAKHGVPGEGNPSAGLVCVGEAPGATEDETGRPFVGQAGQLLDKILAAIQLSRNDVFICNVLKHRPPGNRNPMPDEVRACSPYLVRQIELIRPRVIVAFGTFAAQTLLDTKEAIGKLRGKIHRYHGVPLVVTYHPAALLRNPGWKRPTWDDVQLARRLLDRSVGS